MATDQRSRARTLGEKLEQPGPVGRGAQLYKIRELQIIHESMKRTPLIRGRILDQLRVDGATQLPKKQVPL